MGGHKNTGLRCALVAGALGLLVPGCGFRETMISAESRSGSSPAALMSASRAVVEDYLKAASSADGARMYALLASSERDNETPQSLRKTAADRYTAGMTWKVMKVHETGGTSAVIVDIQGAKVEPNPYEFTLSRESGEWRIVDSPELHEREKKGGLRIKL